MSFLEVFQYTRQDSVVHRLDPRSKLVMAIVLAMISLLFMNIVPLLILLSVLLPLIGLARSLQRWAKSMSGLSVLIVFIVIFNTLLSTVANPFSYSIALSLRLIALMSSFSLFFLTVHPDELSQALIQMGVKFEFAFAMSMAMRYVPTLGQEAYAIMDAQKARGVELDRGNILKRIRNIVPIIVPLIIVSIRRALSIAESMESRGFGACENRTYLEQLKFTRHDWALVLVSVVSFCFLVYVRFYLALPPWMSWGLPF
ncbi:energy-coupling factor transporter transmembrane protein EcfT [Candidatus Thorarchaeota archaeon]|jgi:energy-coupling factor transport system permease protein|nr:MAG: energy-coupling factor transporter transmembrane protein EcfT [Candidatus Thorarchaeota archaeon]